jgi:amidohydrolase
MIADIPARSRAEAPHIIELRRAFHRLPEVGLDLPGTAALVRAELDRLGVAWKAAGSGTMADIGTRGPLVGMRADMDALPVTEKTGLAWTSTVPGRMHACGHDAHMASLLGAAAILKAEADAGRLAFRARLIFQPGEEGFFGARTMIEAGCLEGLVAIEGGHAGELSDELEPGELGFMPGAMMAASDTFRGSFVGSGGHGSAPHHSPDPIAAFAAWIQALNNLRSRELDQRKPAVISVCSVHSGNTHNVIPERLDFEGTARSLEPGLRERLKARIGELGTAVASMWGLRFEYDYEDGYPPLVNDAAASDAMEEGCRAILGSRVKRMTMPSMGGEDFAYYLGKVPGAFWFFSTQAPGRGIGFPNHNPRFDLDEGLLADATAIHLACAQALART